MNAAARANLNKGAKSWASPSRRLLNSPLCVKMFQSSRELSLPPAPPPRHVYQCLPTEGKSPLAGLKRGGRLNRRGWFTRLLFSLDERPGCSPVCVWHTHPQTLTCTAHRQTDTNTGTLYGCGSKQTSNNGSLFGISPLDLHRPSYITRYMWNYWKSQTQEIKCRLGNGCKQLSMLQTRSE